MITSAIHVLTHYSVGQKKLNTFSLLYSSIQTQEIDIDIYTTYNMNNFTEIQMSPTQLHH
jgi:hypothetical protein